MERACLKTYEGGDKRPCQQYSVCGIPFGDRDPSSRGQYHLQPIKSIQVEPQMIGGS